MRVFQNYVSTKEVECHGEFTIVITFQLHYTALKCVSLILTNQYKGKKPDT